MYNAPPWTSPIRVEPFHIKYWVPNEPHRAPATRPHRAWENDPHRCPATDPYGAWETKPHCARASEQTNAEAGPSSLPPLILPVNPPTVQPPRGQSETTVDAEHNESNVEEDEAPVSDFYHSHIPRVSDPLFGVKSQTGPRHENEFESTSAGSGRIHVNWSNGTRSEWVSHIVRTSRTLLRVSKTLYLTK
jgi:hypothetical protein